MSSSAGVLSLCKELPRYMLKSDKVAMYGESERFDELKKEAISTLSSKLIDMRKRFSESELEDPTCFKAVVEMAANLRLEMARATNTPDAEDFGVVRNSDTSEKLYMCTPLYSEQYKEVNQRIKELIIDCISKLKNKMAQEKTITLGNSRYIYRLRQDIDDMVLVNRLLDGLKNRKRDVANGTHNTTDEISFSIRTAEQYKTSEKPLLARLQLQNASKSGSIAEVTALVEELMREYAGSDKQKHAPADKNIFTFSGRIELKVGDEWRVLTRHASVIPCNTKGKIGEEEKTRYKLHGFVHMLHTSHEDFHWHESSMARIFNKILDTDTAEKDMCDLIKQLEYRLHHLCYYKRGSAAMTEMIIEAIKDAICPSYQPRGNLRALSEPFLSQY